MKSGSETSIWHLVGGGAIGMALAYRLHAIGEQVRLSTRSTLPDPVELTYRYGDTPAVTWSCPTEQSVGRSAGEVAGPTVNRLVITTKAFSVAEALVDWGPTLAPGARVYLLQNGTGFRRPGDLPDHVRPLIVVNSGFAAFQPAARSVVQTACEPLWVGNDAGDAAPASPEVSDDLDRLVAAGFLAEWTPSIRAHQWLKIGVNAVINPLTAIFGCQNGALLEREDARQLVEDLCAENAQVLDALGFGGEAGDLLSATQHIIWATATNISSMLADLKRGDGQSELEFINHQLIRAAADHGVPVPINQKIHDQAAAVFLESRSA
jgi:2-dehydropantoate 2-reductase